MNNRHPWQLKKLKSWGPFWSYQLNSTTNPAYLPQNLDKLAKLAVLFSWYLQNGPQDFNFFNCPGCWIFILCEIHCYLCPPKSWHNNSFLGSVHKWDLQRIEHSIPKNKAADFGFFALKQFGQLLFWCSGYGTALTMWKGTIAYILLLPFGPFSGINYAFSSWDIDFLIT